MRRLNTCRLGVVLLGFATGIGCSGSSNSGPGLTGGDSAMGGSVNTGGSSVSLGGTSSAGGSASMGGSAVASGGKNTGGSLATTGGAIATGAAPSTGGITNTAGSNATGGMLATGGSIATGGTKATTTGGSTSNGGTTATGGTKAAAGATASGGTLASGGTASTGGSKATGGTTPAGGTPSTGGTKATGGTLSTGGVKATGGTTATGGSAAIAGAPSFHCVNWADPRDNYVNGLLALSGLSSSTDTYATVQTKADAILSEFQTKLSANAIRIPINEPTVSGTWWNAYKAVIDTAVGKGMKVIVAYWAYQNGMPNDATAFTNMWQTVVSAYQSNNLVYFDIHNEPYGYGSGWNNAAAQWLTNFPNVPRGRVIVAGTGYDDTVPPVGSDTRFAGCLLQLHIYGFWHDTWTAQQQWRDSMTTALGSYSARTIVGEWGAAMTTGMDYSVNTDGDAYRSYIRAVSDIMHNNAMGSCYWPGLRNGDSYSMTTLNTSGSSLTLTVNNASGLDRLHWAWGI
jgi:endoglucanase